MDYIDGWNACRAAMLTGRPMDRDELVQLAADAIGAITPCVMSRDEARSLARAALAIIEPAVREDDAQQADRYQAMTRFRVYTPDGAIHLIRRADPIAPAREFPDYLRIERADVRQPPQIIEDVSDE